MAQWRTQITFDYVHGALIDAAILGACHSLLPCVTTFSKTDTVNGLHIECLRNVFILSRLGNDRHGLFNIHACPERLLDMQSLPNIDVLLRLFGIHQQQPALWTHTHGCTACDTAYIASRFTHSINPSVGLTTHHT
ncbi:Uncharacterised protein [Vibrio cholerae]|uniref:Uncharacterized protein n=1 Tax=Vibrio cholerae TaxID=666 RepID=A0A655ZPT8_VIBCL|nr:Uncharacterised protein [Vibrio cholerae]